MWPRAWVSSRCAGNNRVRSEGRIALYEDHPVWQPPYPGASMSNVTTCSLVEDTNILSTPQLLSSYIKANQHIAANY